VRDRIYTTERYMLLPVHLSCLSVTWVDQSKAFAVRIMQLSPQSSPITRSFLVVNFTA